MLLFKEVVQRVHFLFLFTFVSGHHREHSVYFLERDWIEALVPANPGNILHYLLDLRRLRDMRVETFIEVVHFFERGYGIFYEQAEKGFFI